MGRLHPLQTHTRPRRTPHQDVRCATSISRLSGPHMTATEATLSRSSPPLGSLTTSRMEQSSNDRPSPPSHAGLMDGSALQLRLHTSIYRTFLVAPMFGVETTNGQAAKPARPHCSPHPLARDICKTSPPQPGRRPSAWPSTRAMAGYPHSRK